VIQNGKGSGLLHYGRTRFYDTSTRYKIFLRTLPACHSCQQSSSSQVQTLNRFKRKMNSFVEIFCEESFFRENLDLFPSSSKFNYHINWFFPFLFYVWRCPSKKVKFSQLVQDTKNNEDGAPQWSIAPLKSKTTNFKLLFFQIFNKLFYTVHLFHP